MLTILSTIYAQTDLGTEFGSPWGMTFGLGDLISIVLNGGIALGSMITLFTFIFGGISVIRGAGNNDPKAAAQGKQALTYAIMGLVIVLTAYWGIRLIEIVTGSTFLTNPAPPLAPPSGCPSGGDC